MAKTALICDNGLYVELGLRLARREGWKILFYSPWQRSYPLAKDMAIGAGLDGIERVNHPLSLIGTQDEPDFWIFPDLYHADLQHHLRALGKRVWGCGDGDLLERDRWFLYETLKKGKQGVPATGEIQGVGNLANYLAEEEQECYVKISTYRGEMETEHHKTWQQSKGDWYDDLVQRLGPLGSAMRFIIQEPIPDAIEIGWDGIVIDGIFSARAMLGAECKDKAYLGCVVDTGKLPPIIYDPMASLSDYMSETGYKNFFSTELRITEDGASYLTDATCRLPSPPFECELENIANLGEIIEMGTLGYTPMPTYRKKWAAQIVLRSKKAVHQPVRVEVPERVRDSVKLYRLLGADGGLWVMPDETGMAEIGSVVGLGDTPERAMDAAKQVAKEVDCYQLEYDVKALDEAAECMEKAKKIIGWEE